MKKVLMLLFVAIGLASCSKDTLDSIERDTAQNIIRINKWYDVIKTVSVADAADVTTVLVGAGENTYMEFRANNNAYIMRTDNSWSDPIPYLLKGEKVMEFDGLEYQIQENIISTIGKFTLKRVDGPTTTTIQFRRR
ncbi:hypothetical protein [Sphingobacterium hotanense]|uniref:Lipocalin-like domain-containing protein n=1 Tax=Sphingobacterium hotanense TaxID=649196 RepID=A0ABT7NL99_9SPHI|nr:hypothetical protein [Sphingobacterium hotanense]MCT1526127.1 hypothetical protein [Sphingobacterium hotanense]MDM1048024.1 hypothetical protein [Sphingobacterium hotanense]